MSKGQKKPVECMIFNCDHRHFHACCSFCDKVRRCSNRCLNSPDKCGLYMQPERKGEAYAH